MATLTVIHVVLSLAGIGSGVVVLRGMLRGARLDGWTAIFLTTSIATTLTGFVFPYHGFLPVHGVGVASIVALAVAIVARYVRRLAGQWRAMYAVSAVATLYLNVVVLVAQLFMKVPALAAMAPTLAERPFVIAQAALFVVFAGLAIAAVRRFRVPVSSFDRSIDR
jgi:hypothetical protein